MAQIDLDHYDLDCWYHFGQAELLPFNWSLEGGIHQIADL